MPVTATEFMDITIQVTSKQLLTIVRRSTRKGFVLGVVACLCASSYIRKYQENESKRD